MKKLLLSTIIWLSLIAITLPQGGPNADMGGGTGTRGGIAQTQSDNEALRRILYALRNSAATGTSSGATTVSSSAKEASHVLKNSSGILISVAGYNSKATAQFIQLFNSTTVPSNGAVPIQTITVPGLGNFSIVVPITGTPFSTGIAVSNSSTDATLTIGSADVFYTAVVK